MSSFINNLRKTMGNFGACVEETVGDDLFPTIHVKNDPLSARSFWLKRRMKTLL